MGPDKSDFRNMRGSPIFSDIGANLNNSRHFIFEMFSLGSSKEKSRAASLQLLFGMHSRKPSPFMTHSGYGSLNEKVHSCAILV